MATVNRCFLISFTLLSAILPVHFLNATNGALPSITDTIFITNWLICGPFSIGTREGITEAFEDLTTITPQEHDSLLSGLVQGGFLQWRSVTTDSLGWLNTDYPDVRWDSIQDYYGVSGLASVGYAYAEFYCHQKSRALAVATKLGSFILNGRSYLGDVYGNNWFKSPVVLDSGINRVILRISGYGDQRVRLLFIPVASPVIVFTQDITAPDLIADSVTDAWLGIPLMNTTDKPINQIKIKLSLDTFTVCDTVIHRLPPLTVKKPALRTVLPALPYDTNGYRLVINTTVDNQEIVDTFRLRSRLINQPHKRTFISRIDSSCQYYALLYPENYQPDKKYSLIISLHGAGVEAYSLAECFKPKDWAFVVCPTNRRPFGFDWQDWGRIDVMEAMAEAHRQLPVEPDQILLTGHSMGGHGTWHIGLAHPDIFAGIAPAAGWPSFPLYIPNFLQRSIIFAEPRKLAIREMALRPDNTPAHLENALNLPVFILHGGDDDNVPPIHGRQFALWLDVLGYQYHYKEVHGKKHWWVYPDGTVCVDDPDLMAFLKSCRRDPGPRHIRFRTADLGQTNRAYWLKIDRVKTVGVDATVEAQADDSTITIKTTNCTRLTLTLDQRLFFNRPIRLIIDHQKIAERIELPAVIVLHNTEKGWQLSREKRDRLSKQPKLYGPAKQAYFSPFAIVYGTRDTAIADYLYHSASQEALRWWLIGNGTTEVIADTEFIPLDRNLILFGGPQENLFTARISDRLPIRVNRGKMQLEKIALGESLAAIFVYPNPLNSSKLVLVRMGTDLQATKLAFFWGILGSGTAIPDFMIFDRLVRRFGWHGVRSAGFFSPDWQIDFDSSFIEK